MSYAIGWAGLMLGMASSGPLIFSFAMKDNGDPRWKWVVALGLCMIAAAIALICVSVIGAQP